MFQLAISGGATAGQTHLLRRFPFRVGRNADADLQCEESGVWDNHLVFEKRPDQGITVRCHPEAHAALNGAPLSEAVVLRNGDVVEIGPLKLRFWLGETEPRPLALRETLTWLGLGALFLAQLLLALRFLP